jgi:putative membrane protein
MWHMDDVGWGWWLLMSVGMVAFWGLVIFGVFWLARGASAPAQASATPSGQPGSPQEVLKRRLASGEIRVDEYDALRTVIDAPAPAEPPGAAVR